MVNNKYKKQKQVQDKLTSNSLEDAIKKIKELSALKKRKFVESVDIAVNLGIDPKQSDQSVKGSILLPNGSGKKIKVIVFTGNEDLQKIANDSGALMSGLDDLIAKIEGGFLDFDCCIATPDVMQKISKVAKKLGPRGLMPSPKNGTVTNDIKKAVSDAIKGKAGFKNDKGGTVHCLIGKVNFETEHLLQNAQAVIKAIKDAKPENAKGKYIKAFYLNSTMGPSIEVSVESV
ncbi:MAG: 50S ribosomal protein L1 [Proteobacteria bacterium]|nr:50S ribosomal protein L1 [Pseudomonadota bacterium]NCA28361.1 50S ribosomal protein L1 [Pseudomonadota bacterium]